RRLRDPSGARRRGALVPLSDGAERAVTPAREPRLSAPEHANAELALAVFASAHDTHAVDGETRSARFRRFRAAFDGRAYLRGLAAAGFRWLPGTGPAFPFRLPVLPHL